MNDTPALVPVPVGACRCPGEPHADGDVVYLYPKLGLEAGIAVQAAMQLSEDGQPRLRAVYAALIDNTIADWTLTNGDGSKIQINPATIRAALPWMEGGQEVANTALLRFAEVFTTNPLARRPARSSRRTGKSSRRGPTAATSTSAIPAS